MKYDSRNKICIQLHLISPKRTYLTSVDNVQQFVVDVQKCVCIIFCKVIIVNNMVVLVICEIKILLLQYYIVIHLCIIGVSEIKVKMNFGSTCINLNNVYNKF